jgi:hypothetical protein
MAAIKTASEGLSNEMQKIGEAMAKATQNTAGAQSAPNQGEEKKDEKVRDADYEEKKDDKGEQK